MVRMFKQIFWLSLIVAVMGCSSSSSSSSTSSQLVAITIQAANVKVPLGTGYQFSAIGTYTDSSTANLTTSVTWSSSNASVATISNTAGSNGTVSSLAGGSTTILAASGSVSASTSLTVVPIGGGSQGTPLVLSGDVSTIAGSATLAGAIDAAGAAARFSLPVGIATDGSNLYIADADNNTIRKLVLSSGVVSTLAGTAGQAGTTDATGTAARFLSPRGITTDGLHLYVAEMQSHTIRKIDISSGVVTTIAGSAGAQGSADAAGTSARFNSPTGITTDGINLYVSDTGNNTIRKIVISSGAVSTLAGTAGQSGSSDAAGTLASFSQPVGITTDGINLYVTDFGNSTIRQIVIAGGVVSTLAGSPGLAGSADGAGSIARFSNPATGITTDGTNLYVADYGNHTIRAIVISTRVVSTLAGNAGHAGTAAGVGAVARFNHPEGITSDGKCLFIADSDNDTIRKLN